MHCIHLSQVTFAFPGFAPILDNVSIALEPGIIALAGPNGAGKTTLMRLMMRELMPQRGRIIWQRIENIGWLPQNIATGARKSSGEAKMRQLESLLRSHDGVVFLDEPETHLDGPNRRWLRRALERHRGLVVITSHDPVFLDQAQLILHTEMARVTPYRMRYTAYVHELAERKAKQAASINRARHELIKSERARRIQLERQLRRSRNAAANAPLAGIPRVARGLMKRNAEKTLGKLISRHRQHTGADQEALARLLEQKASAANYCFPNAKPGSGAPAYLEVSSLQLYGPNEKLMWTEPLSFRANKGEKIRITGANGSGKSMLLRAVSGRIEFHNLGTIALGSGKIRIIDSGHTGIATDASPLVLALDAGVCDDTGEARRLLGAYGFSGDAALRPFRTLSAGEKIRLQLFLVSHGRDSTGYLFSDEAETGLDHISRQAFADYLNAFPGIVLIVSHDEAFVNLLHIHRTLALPARQY